MAKKAIDPTEELAKVKAGLRQAHDAGARLAARVAELEQQQSERRVEVFTERVLDAADKLETTIIPLENVGLKSVELNPRDAQVKQIRILINAVRGKGA